MAALAQDLYAPHHFTAGQRSGALAFLLVRTLGRCGRKTLLPNLPPEPGYDPTPRARAKVHVRDPAAGPQPYTATRVSPTVSRRRRNSGGGTRHMVRYVSRKGSAKSGTNRRRRFRGRRTVSTTSRAIGARGSTRGRRHINFELFAVGASQSTLINNRLTASTKVYR